MALKTYNSSLLTISWLDRTIAEGRAESDFLKIVRNSERSTFQKNAEGGGTRSISNDKSAKIFIKLTQASDSNRLMEQLFALPDTDNVGVFEARDINGNLVYRAARAYPQKEPDRSYSVTAGEREWVLECDELTSEAVGA